MVIRTYQTIWHHIPEDINQHTAQFQLKENRVKYRNCGKLEVDSLAIKMWRQGEADDAWHCLEHKYTESSYIRVSGKMRNKRN
jgi:hypothetical protein